MMFALAALLAVIAYFYPEKFLCVDSGRVSADAIVVLGGGNHERPLRAAKLFRQHAAPRIILTGAGDDDINREILISKRHVPGVGVIQIEDKSHTTRENAEFTIKLLRAEKIHARAILVTSLQNHSRRALKTFEHYAPEIKFYSRPSYFAFALRRLDEAEYQQADAAGVFETARLLDSLRHLSVLNKLALLGRVGHIAEP